MTQKISSVNIETATLSSFTGPTISSVAIANSSYVILDDTAVSNAGGYAVITGSNFASGAQVLFGSTSATSVSFVDSARLNVQVPALTAGSYVMYVQNPDGSTAIRLNGITSSPIPVWGTGSTLTNQVSDAAISISLSATSDSSVIYALANGSSLPAGTTLASNGLFSGTVTGLSNDITYNFSVNAIDAENQETLRAFSVTVTAGDQNFKDTILLLNGETSNNTWITDASSNAFAITVNGDTRPSAFSPYETVWSNYFDGTGDFLTSPLNSVNTRTAFTIESWVYALSRTSLCFYSASSTSSAGDVMYFHELSGTFYFGDSASNPITFSSSSVPLDSWFHMATTFDGTTYRLFINGSLVGSTGTLIANNNLLSIMIGGRTVGATHSSNAYFSNFRVVKGTALYTANFTPPTTQLTAITNTSLLTCQSNRFIDNSTNNYTITRGGNVTVSNFGPFTETDTTTGSGYFDGTGDYLTTAGDNSLVLDADFTIEFSMYLNSLSISGTISNNQGSFISNAFAGIISHATASNKISFWANNINASTSLVVSSTTLTTGQWYHVALVRNAGVIKLYLNGVEESSVTTSGTLTLNGNSAFRIGQYWNGSLNGYMSNVRVIKGTAAYTSNFTVPTSPLTAIANTSLLTLQSRIGENNNRFIDTSGINNIITRSGNTSQGTFSPFQIGGWSNYFDGTGDFLSISNNAAHNPGTSDFVMEAWVYFTGTTGANQGINGKGTAGTDGYSLFITNALVLSFIWNGTGGTTITGGTLSLNTWNHVAVVRNNNVIRLYLNGVGAGSSTACTTDITSTATKFIGQARGGNPMLGYMSNYRMMKGSRPSGYDATTSTLTVPSLPLTAIANTSVLTCADNAFFDDSPNNFTITRNGDASVQPFNPFKAHTIVPNTHSVYFDGTGDYLQIPTNSALAFGTGDFTCESWVYIAAAPGAGSASALWGDIRWSTGYQSGWYTHINPNLTVTARIAGSWTEVISSATVNLNRWNHIAVSRQSGTFRLFVNGVLSGSASSSTNYTNAEPFKVGIAFIDGLIYPFTGYISNLRAVKGVAVYTGNFDLPNVAPLQLSGTLSANSYSSTTNVNTTFVEANTSLLICSSNTIIDLSTVNAGNTAFTITANADVRPTTVNPLGFAVANVSGSSADYSITNEGGSVYFDGTEDRLIIPTNNSLDLTGDFTIEFWIFPTAWAAYNVIFDTSSNGGVGTNMTALYFTNAGALEYYVRGANLLVGSGLVLNQWQHIAITKSGTSQRLFLNGRLITSATSSTQPNSGFSWYFGDRVSGAVNGQYPMKGYLSGVRITKGTALYTNMFVPSTAPPTPISGTTLLLNGTNGGIIDYTRKNNLETFDTVLLRNNIKKYGNTSIFIAGTDDYLVMPYSPNFNLGTGQFTIECWVNFSALTTSRIIFDTYTAASAGGGYQLYWRASGTSIAFYANGGVQAQSSFTTHAVDTWYHVAVTRDSSGIVRIFVDGVMYAYTSYTAAIDIATTARPAVGIQFSTSTNEIQGYIDDLRITKGFSRYSSNTSFTPPTTSFPIK